MSLSPFAFQRKILREFTFVYRLLKLVLFFTTVVRSLIKGLIINYNSDKKVESRGDAKIFSGELLGVCEFVF